jgi:hypothetical protein
VTTPRLDQRLSPLEHAALFDAARRRALEARREAIDEFWTALGRAALSAWRALRRSVKLAPPCAPERHAV